MNATVSQSMRSAQAALSAWYNHLHLVAVGRTELQAVYSEAAAHAVQTFADTVRSAMEQQDILKQLDARGISLVVLEQEVRSMRRQIDVCHQITNDINQTRKRYGEVQISLRMKRAKILTLAEFRHFLIHQFQFTGMDYLKMACYSAWLGDEEGACKALTHGLPLLTSAEVMLLVEQPFQLLQPTSLLLHFCFKRVYYELSSISSTAHDVAEQTRDLLNKLRDTAPSPYKLLL